MVLSGLGKMDPPAGRDVYPILEQVSAYDFERTLTCIMQVYTYVDGKRLTSLKMTN